ncbi:MAG TPA: hypothetical protein VM389_10470 [Phycisphaerae bacterium]|nr:hypothetical protein [Phycisphaerae bacterium]
MAREHDVAVLGATPAGWVAAYALAAKGCDVVVMDSPAATSECPLADWVPKDFFRITGLPGSLARTCKAAEFRTVCYHGADLARDVEYVSRATAGYFLRSGMLVKGLKAAAVNAGAKVRSSRTRPAIHLEEDSVRLLGTVQVAAKLLLIAQNRPFDVLGDLGLPLRTIPRASCLVAGIDIPVTGSALARKLGKTLHVVESREPSEVGMFFSTAGVLHLRVVSKSPASGTRAAELSGLISSLQRTELLPANLPLHRAKGALWSPPVGVALELETHVAKRCILIGTAGGFAETITGHTLTPAARSALIAAEIAAKALQSDNPQGALMAFKTEWRDRLADYLRPPSTSLQLLLPLLFANKRLVTRFTRALLYGEEI